MELGKRCLGSSFAGSKTPPPSRSSGTRLAGDQEATAGAAMPQGHRTLKTYCPDCPNCRSSMNLAVFQKILQHDDVGVSIYRYRVPEAPDEPGQQTPRETFILQTAKNVVELSRDLFAKEFEKCKNYCPRCQEMMRRAEALFRDVPSFHKRGVTSLCGHEDLGKYFQCPRCKGIVDKFLKYKKLAQKDPESTRLQTYLDRSATQVRTPQFSDAVKSAVALQIKEAAETQRKYKSAWKIAGQAAETSAETTTEKTGERKLSAAERGDKENLAPTGKGERKGEGKGKASTASKTSSKSKSTKAQKKERVLLDEDGNTTTSFSDHSQSVSKGKAGKPKKEAKEAKEPKEQKSTKKRKTSQEKRDEKMMKEMRRMIATKQKKDKDSKTGMGKAQAGMDKKASATEKKLQQEEKKRKQADEARRLRLQRLLEKHGGANDIASLDYSNMTEVCSVAPDSGHNLVIRGEKLFRREQLHEQETIIEPPTPSAHPPAKEQSVSFIKPEGGGGLRYSLSNPVFIEKGWTKLPKQVVLRTMTVYRTYPSRPEFDWFELNRHKRELQYDTGEVLATFDEGSYARVHYRSTNLALDYYYAQEAHAGMRLVLYSDSHHERRAVLAMFDYAGNGVVYDHIGNARLKYNQTEGVVLDRKLGPKSHWRWHNLDGLALTNSVMVDNYQPFQDPRILELGEVDSKSNLTRASDTYMKSIELQNIYKHKAKQTKLKYTPYHIKMKAMKINEYFSLKIFDQTAVHLLYCDGRNRFKINMGLVLDPTTIIDEDLSVVGEVTNSLDKSPAVSPSVEQLQKTLQQTRNRERLRIARERRLNRPDPWENIGILSRGGSISPRYECRRFSSICDVIHYDKEKTAESEVVNCYGT